MVYYFVINFDNIWIQPAAGDAGGALGAALSTWYLHRNNQRTASKDECNEGAYLDPEFIYMKL